MMEHLTVSAVSSARAIQSTISEAELKATLKIITVYALQADRGFHSIGESLPPMQISAVQNKIQELLLMF